ncbi:MAG: CHC2 zinc finger domain-containing protein, partial [Desulfatitalea sp.]
MTIAKELIEQVKRTDLLALVRAKGIELKKNGKGYFGLCPFHADKNPSLSINPTKNLWQCFGCGAAGDAIRFVELFDQVDFKEAVKRLSDNGFKTTATRAEPQEPPNTLSVKERKLLARVVAHYQHTLGQDSRGLTYLKQERGITDPQSLKDFGTGYANGTLLEILPQDEEVRQALKKIGILNAKGHELFYNCVVFPLYGINGGIENLYGRNIEEDNGAKHLYLPGPRSGLVNRQAVNRSQTIILTESIIDA